LKKNTRIKKCHVVLSTPIVLIYNMWGTINIDCYMAFVISYSNFNL
jgi:hypothetical protein